MNNEHVVTISGVKRRNLQDILAVPLKRESKLSFVIENSKIYGVAGNKKEGSLKKWEYEIGAFATDIDIDEDVKLLCLLFDGKSFKDLLNILGDEFSIQFMGNKDGNTFSVSDIVLSNSEINIKYNCSSLTLGFNMPSQQYKYFNDGANTTMLNITADQLSTISRLATLKTIAAIDDNILFTVTEKGLVVKDAAFEYILDANYNGQFTDKYFDKSYLHHIIPGDYEVKFTELTSDDGDEYSSCKLTNTNGNIVDSFALPELDATDYDALADALADDLTL